MTDWGRLFVVILNRGDETLARFSNYLPNNGKGLKIMMNFDLWFFFFFWMKQTSSICPVREAAHPQLRWRAEWERRCPGGAGNARGAQCWRVPLQGPGATCSASPGHLPSSPSTPQGASSQGRGPAQICSAPPGSLHKSVKETWGVQNSRAKNSFLGKKRNQNKTAKPQTRILRWAETWWHRQ